MKIPDDIRNLFQSKTAAPKSKKVLYYLWTYGANTGKVLLDTDDSRPRKDHRYHEHMGEDHEDTDLIHGYAYRIKDGWRITDIEHNSLDDGHIKLEIIRAIRKREG